MAARRWMMEFLESRLFVVPALPSYIHGLKAVSDEAPVMGYQSAWVVILEHSEGTNGKDPTPATINGSSERWPTSHETRTRQYKLRSMREPIAMPQSECGVPPNPISVGISKFLEPWPS